MAFCFSRNMALFLNIFWIYVVFNWLEVGFILTGTADTTRMNHLKIVFLNLNNRLYGVTVRMTAILIVTTGRTSNLTDPTIKKDCLGKAEDVNLWLWDQNQDRNQWRALASKVTKLQVYIKCVEFLDCLSKFCLLCPRRQSDISHCLAWSGTLSTVHHIHSPADSFFSPSTGSRNRYERLSRNKFFTDFIILFITSDVYVM